MKFTYGEYILARIRPITWTELVAFQGNQSNIYVARMIENRAKKSK